MLPQTKINEIVAEVATATFTRENFEKVLSEPTVDSQGDEALRITVVIKPEAVEKLKGDPVLDFLLGIHHRLQEAGEERFPIVEYATPEELDELVDPES
jgi:hypothetical protein